MKSILIVAATVTMTVLPGIHATPVDITVSSGSSAIAAPKSDLGNFGDNTVLTWLASDINSYNTLNGTSLGAPLTVAGQIGQTSGVGGNSITLDVTGYQYLFFHWGGKDGGWAEAYYVGGSTGSYTFNNTPIGTNPQVGGLSFYSFYNSVSVPDGGSTMLMLGAAFSALGLIVRRVKAQDGR
jgi:hypothetical protein